MIEIIVVMALMLILLGLSAPFVTSLRSDISMNKVIRQIKTDLITNLGYSLAGKSITALSQGDLTNPELIPSHYALYFKADDDYGDQTPYSYIEMRAEVANGSDQMAEKLYQVDKEYPTPSVYLKNIRMVNGVTQEVDSAYIIFTPPFGKIYFVPGGSYDSFAEGDMTEINLTDALNSSHDYSTIELDFQYKDDETTLTTLTFSTDKIINIK